MNFNFAGAEISLNNNFTNTRTQYTYRTNNNFVTGSRARKGSDNLYYNTVTPSPRTSHGAVMYSQGGLLRRTAPDRIHRRINHIVVGRLAIVVAETGDRTITALSPPRVYVHFTYLPAVRQTVHAMLISVGTRTSSSSSSSSSSSLVGERLPIIMRLANGIQPTVLRVSLKVRARVLRSQQPQLHVRYSKSDGRSFKNDRTSSSIENSTPCPRTVHNRRV